MFEKIKQLLSKSEKPEPDRGQAASRGEQIPVIEREKSIYGEDRIARQKLYEKWVSKDVWVLRTEGIKLLQGVDPGCTDNIDPDTQQQLQELWEHAIDCVRKKLLTVNNTDIPEEQWQVTPTDLYCWATVSRVNVPPELSGLMEFVLQTVKVKPVTKTVETAESENAGNDQRYQQAREITLGAAVSLLANNPEACRTRRGNVKANLIAAEIMKNADAWFGKEQPVLAQSAMEDLINRYIAESRVLVNLSGD